MISSCVPAGDPYFIHIHPHFWGTVIQSPRSLKYEYELYVEGEIEDYKDSVSRGALLKIGDEAVEVLRKQDQIALTERLVYTQKALSILDTALEFYPAEVQLRDSVEAVKEFNSSIKLSYLIELAEKAAFKGDEPEALNLYRDALFFMEKDEYQSPERRLIEENIVAEIEKIEQNYLIKD